LYRLDNFLFARFICDGQIVGDQKSHSNGLLPTVLLFA
jgi:hypothetical protein